MYHQPSRVYHQPTKRKATNLDYFGSLHQGAGDGGDGGVDLVVDDGNPGLREDVHDTNTLKIDVVLKIAYNIIYIYIFI